MVAIVAFPFSLVRISLRRFSWRSNAFTPSAAETYAYL